MNPKDIPSILELLATPGIALAAGIWIYFSLREIRKEVTGIKEYIKSMHDNGFVTKEMCAVHGKTASILHEELVERVQQLEGRLNRS